MLATTATNGLVDLGGLPRRRRAVVQRRTRSAINVRPVASPDWTNPEAVRRWMFDRSGVEPLPQRVPHALGLPDWTDLDSARRWRFQPVPINVAPDLAVIERVLAGLREL